MSQRTRHPVHRRAAPTVIHCRCVRAVDRSLGSPAGDAGAGARWHPP